MGDPAGAGSNHPKSEPNNKKSTPAELKIWQPDPDLFAIADKRIDALITCIQPTELAESRRRAVYLFVQRLIRKCFDCQVFTFGSVPLKTYLPDGDIDLTAFTQNQSLKDNWAQEVRAALEEEERRPSSEFRVKEVQYIHAEVKLVKCLVENIVVDISVNQLGGLCTLCFLEEVDRLIGQNHLFKRSIILVKAWCYYESRLLGAHHGLISTYALETLVLYIFHVYHNLVTSPLQVLLRFLEYFSAFDWDKYILSLHGPIPISRLPAVDAETPTPASGALLLSEAFLDECHAAYAVLPGVRDASGNGSASRPFAAKFMNILDPLLATNNLGRSVSKGNFYRIRSAFSYGYRKVKEILSSPPDQLLVNLNRFFANTWERHGSGQRPDALQLQRGPMPRARFPNPLVPPPGYAFPGPQPDLSASWHHFGLSPLPKGPKSSPNLGPQTPQFAQYSPRLQALALAQLTSPANSLESSRPGYMYPPRPAKEGSPRLNYNHVSGLAYGGPPPGYLAPPPVLMLPPNAALNGPLPILGPPSPSSSRGEETQPEPAASHLPPPYQRGQGGNGMLPHIPLPVPLQIPSDQPPFAPRSSGAVPPSLVTSHGADLAAMMHILLPPSPSTSGAGQTETPSSVPVHHFSPHQASPHVLLEGKVEPGRRHEPPALDPYTADGRIHSGHGQTAEQENAGQKDAGEVKAGGILPKQDPAPLPAAQTDVGDRLADAQQLERLVAKQQAEHPEAERLSSSSSELPLPPGAGLPPPPEHTKEQSRVPNDSAPLLRTRSANTPGRTISEPSLKGRASPVPNHGGLRSPSGDPQRPFMGTSSMGPFPTDPPPFSLLQSYSPFHFFPLNQLPPGMLPFFHQFGAPPMAPQSEGGNPMLDPSLLPLLPPEEFAAVSTSPHLGPPSAPPSPALGVGARLREQGMAFGGQLLAGGSFEGSDLLKGDFESHLHNLEWGRICQSHQGSGPKGPPAQSPGDSAQNRQPWEGPGRPGLTELANGMANPPGRGGEFQRTTKGGGGNHAETELGKAGRPVQYGSTNQTANTGRVRSLSDRGPFRNNDRGQGSSSTGFPGYDSNHRGGLGSQRSRGTSRGDARVHSSWVVSEASQAKAREGWSMNENTLPVRVLHTPPAVSVVVPERPAHPVVQMPPGLVAPTPQPPTPSLPSPSPAHLPPTPSRTSPPIVMPVDRPPILSTPFVIGSANWDSEGPSSRPSSRGSVLDGGVQRPKLEQGEGELESRGAEGAKGELPGSQTSLPSLTLSRAGSASDLQGSRRSYSLTEEDFPPLATVSTPGGSRSTTNSPRSGGRGARHEHRSARGSKEA